MISANSLVIRSTFVNVTLKSTSSATVSVRVSAFLSVVGAEASVSVYEKPILPLAISDLLNCFAPPHSVVYDASVTVTPSISNASAADAITSAPL